MLAILAQYQLTKLSIWKPKHLMNHLNDLKIESLLLCGYYSMPTTFHSITFANKCGESNL